MKLNETEFYDTTMSQVDGIINKTGVTGGKAG